MVEAAKAASIHDYIMSLPGGYQTEVGERGSRLSGGQRQRLAVARALLRDTPVVLLDEPTSGLDKENERVVLQSIAKLLQGRTVLMVTHRWRALTGEEAGLSAQPAARFLVMDAGNPVELGTHEELMAHRGLYERLYRSDATEP